ncbi:MAG: hypothetical protein LBP76_12895 [Treponema sp.]|jgi:hypothetical protein|nr:hypothetical protein [Treponema sp.]
MKRLLKRIGIALLLLLVAFNVLALPWEPNIFTTLGEAANMHYRGNNQVEQYMDASRNAKTGVRNSQGVAFYGVAVPEGNTVGQPVSLDYNAGRDDGNRLHVKIGAAAPVNSGLYDWEIVPLAYYADSPYTGAVTFLGDPPDTEDTKLTDIAEAAAGEGKNAFWIKYHPDLGNTLVGYNLCLVDAMLVVRGEEPINAKVRDFAMGDAYPRIQGYNDSGYAIDESAKTMAAEFEQKLWARYFTWDTIPTYMDDGTPTIMLVAHRDAWDTYIYSDDGMPITYRLNGNKIEFTGYPVYQHMKARSCTWNLTLTEGKSIPVELPLDLDLTMVGLDMYPTLGNDMAKRWLITGNSIENCNFMRVNYEAVSELVDFMRMRESYEAMKAVNPVVFNAAERACHWTAFFRAVKKDHENAWVSFLDMLKIQYPKGSEDPAIRLNTPRLWVAD